MKQTLPIYLIALALLTASASIAPYETYERKLRTDICDDLVDKLPCEDATGPWTHVCKAAVSVSCNTLAYAIVMSRQLPEHVAAFALRGIGSNEDGEKWGIRQQTIVRPLGLSLGLALLTLGRILYNPLLFYLPAVLVGYAAIQPVVPYLENELGISSTLTAIVASALFVLLAYLQRHVVVWLFGLLLGLLSFIAIFVGTSYLNGLPIQVLIGVGIACALIGSSIMLSFEKTYLWKVLACALVGSVLFTDAIGLSQISSFLQWMMCSILVISSCWRQLGPSWSRRARTFEEKSEKSAASKRRRSTGSDCDIKVKDRRSLSALILSPRNVRKRKPSDSEDDTEDEEATEEITSGTEVNRNILVRCILYAASSFLWILQKLIQLLFGLIFGARPSQDAKSKKVKRE
mmetsp:Transcript_13006/g.29904  ORF Transcript_13006/g.29904 Transcript_13006/m.29904 type:complete len:404 (-) Transcript_13006:16-1227(-)